MEGNIRPTNDSISAVCCESVIDDIKIPKDKAQNINRIHSISNNDNEPNNGTWNTNLPSINIIIAFKKDNNK